MQYLFSYAGAALVLAMTLAGLVLLGVGVVRILTDLVLDLRASRISPEPLDDQLLGFAAAAVERVSGTAGADVPTVVVLPLLGRPFPGPQRRSVGTGGLAITRFAPGRPISIVLARAALTNLSVAALTNLIAHELAHVIQYRTLAGKVRHYAWAIGFLMVTLSMAAWMVATRSTPMIAATGAVALAYLAVRMFWQRREELAADRFAIALTADLGGAEELMRFYEENMRDRPLPEGRVRRAITLLERRWLATHPEPHDRLAAMRSHIVEMR